MFATMREESPVISGGESRDWDFSNPVAARMSLPHCKIYKDGKMLGAEVFRRPVVHIADLNILFRSGPVIHRHHNPWKVGCQIKWTSFECFLLRIGSFLFLWSLILSGFWFFVAWIFHNVLLVELDINLSYLIHTIRCCQFVTEHQYSVN